MKYVVLLVLLVGCVSEVVQDDAEYVADYDDAMRSTVEAWEELIGPIDKKCHDSARNTIVEEVDSYSEFPENCRMISLESGYSLGGCHTLGIISNEGNVKYQDYIYILSTRREKAKAETAVHEFIHMLAFCERADGDIGHTNKQLWEEYGIDTVEAYGCANLRIY